MMKVLILLLSVNLNKRAITTEAKPKWKLLQEKDDSDIKRYIELFEVPVLPFKAFPLRAYLLALFPVMILTIHSLSISTEQRPLLL